MNHEQLSVEAENLYNEHAQVVGRISTAKQQRSEAGYRRDQTASDLLDARIRHDDAVESYLYGKGSSSRAQSLKDDRSRALDRHTKAESDYITAGLEIDLAESDSSANLQASASHYAANTDAYHELAVQDALDSGVEINFGGKVATNVRTAK